MDVTLIGHPFIPVGRGEHIRAVHRALAEVGIAAKVYDIFERPTREERPSAELSASLVKQIGGGIRIFHCNGSELESVVSLLTVRQPNFFDRDYNIVYPAWELPIYPAPWARQINRFNEVWAASDFVYRSLINAVSIPVLHIPNACEPRLPKLLDRAYHDLPANAFLFLFFFDLSSYSTRKNPLAVIEVVRRLLELRPNRNIHLVIKYHRGEMTGDDSRIFEEAVENLGVNVTVLKGTASDQEIKSLILCCDCFISLHRSEGFGRGPAEAMFFGKPVIATGWSGNMDYMNSDVSFPVTYDLTPVGETEYLFPEGQVWAEPDIGDAVGKALLILDDAKMAKEMGDAACRHMKENFSNAVLGGRYAARFAEIAASVSSISGKL